MIVPFTKTPQGQPPAQGGPMPSETNLLMALAEMHKQGRFDQVASNESSPFLKRLQPGEWGTPAQLYNEHKASGLDKDEARDAVIKNLKSGGKTDKDIEEQFMKVPGS